MKFIRLIIGLLAAVAALPAFAQTTETAAIVGKVVKIYVRESANFFIETNLVRNARGKQYWSEVRFAEPLADGRTSEMVRLAEAATVERGDLVSAQLAAKRELVPGLLPEVNRMVALVAKHDTVAAMTFDAAKPAKTTGMPYVPALQALR